MFIVNSGVDYEKKKRKFGSPKLEMDKKKIVIKLGGGGSSTDSSDDVRRTRSMSCSAVDVKQLEDKKRGLLEVNHHQIYQIILISCGSSSRKRTTESGTIH